MTMTEHALRPAFTSLSNDSVQNDQAGPSNETPPVLHFCASGPACLGKRSSLPAMRATCARDIDSDLVTRIYSTRCLARSQRSEWHRHDKHNDTQAGSLITLRQISACAPKPLTSEQCAPFMHKFCRINTHMHECIIYLYLLRCLDERTACIFIYSSDIAPSHRAHLFI